MRNEVDAFQYVAETNKLLKKDGLFLVAEGEDKKPNAMTIGWGFLGTMWSKPVFIVAVRYSRHTYKLMEESDSFTVCLPAKDMEKALAYCGSKSGRDMDKIKDMGLSTKKGKTVDAPYIKESPVHYECKVVYKDEMEEGRLSEHFQTSMYKTKDWHVLYYGEITGCYAVEGADDKLMK